MDRKNEKIALSTKGLEMINPYVAGIGIGSKVHYICAPADRDNVNIKLFCCFTEDMNMIATWLKKCRIKSVAINLQVSAGCDMSAQSPFLRIPPRTAFTARYL